jgi:hypothetical protein
VGFIFYAISFLLLLLGGVVTNNLFNDYASYYYSGCIAGLISCTLIVVGAIMGMHKEGYRWKR